MSNSLLLFVSESDNFTLYRQDGLRAKAAKQLRLALAINSRSIQSGRSAKKMPSAAGE